MQKNGLYIGSLFIILVIAIIVLTGVSPLFAHEMPSDIVVAERTRPAPSSSPLPSSTPENLGAKIVRTAEEIAARISTTLGSDSGSKNQTGSGTTFSDPRVYPPTDDLDPTLWEGGIAPTPDAPSCADHNDTAFHTIWNKELGCHYDHTHGYDPSKTMFKDVVASWDQEISYPWHTPHENEYKHKGYIYLYTEAKNGCELGRRVTAKGCIRKILYQLHSIGTNMEVTTRFHSFRFVAEVCNLDQSECGIVQGGGQTDYGVTHCPYKKVNCPKTSDPLPLLTDGGILPDMVAISQPPYVANGTLADEARLRRSGRNTQFWNGFPPNPVVSAYYPNKPNNLLGTAWSSLDGWTMLDPSDGYQEHFFCEKGDCKFNHSEFRLYSLSINLPSSMGDLKTGFTNMSGHLDTTCQTANTSCASLSIGEGTPKNVTTFYLDRQVNPLFAPELEFDICFNSSTKLPEGCNTKLNVTSGWLTPQVMPAMTM